MIYFFLTKHAFLLFMTLFSPWKRFNSHLIASVCNLISCDLLFNYRDKYMRQLLMAISEIEQRISDLVFPPVLEDRRRQHSFVCGRKASVVSINNSFIAFFFSFFQQPPLSSHPVMVVFNKSQLNPLRQKARNQPGLNNLMRKTNINVKADPIKTCFPSRVCVRMYGSLPNTLSMSGL